MQRILARIRFPTLLIFVYAGITAAAATLYTGLGAEEPALFSLAAKVGWLWVIGWWQMEDISRRCESWFYCPGLFLQAAWPFVLSYYLLKTRGPRALIPIALFVAVWIAAAVIGAATGLMLGSY